MKRKRKNACPSPLLDDSPKRTKVQAQRKFAQGSNVNSPVITPIKELESELPSIDTLPEPVELLPIKRPNTEDFLTFLCFRGTPILPPTLNFFNTASIVDTNGQVHEIKSESSPKNGPIDIAKCGSSSERPFVAFGVRKRADPIVISKQMDRKRRHALALQALRRKYQEQKMAKIRAVAISKLSERVTNKTLVKTNTVSKTETVTKKSTTMQKTKVVATKHVKVTTQTMKTTLRPSVNQRMCLRSFRGRCIQKELPFRKKIITDKLITKPAGKKIVVTKRVAPEVRDQEKDSKTSEMVKKPSEATGDNSSRMTRSSIVVAANRRKQQKRIIIPDPKTMVKPRILRSTTMKKTVLSRRRSRVQKSKQKLRTGQKDKEEVERKLTKPPGEMKRDFKKVTDFKKESNTFYEKDKKQVNRSLDIRREMSKSTDIKKNVSKVVEIKRSVRISNVIEKRNVARDPVNVPPKQKVNEAKKAEETTVKTTKKPKKPTDSPTPQTRSKHVTEEKEDDSKPKKETTDNPKKSSENMNLRSSKKDRVEPVRKKDDEKPPPPSKGETLRKKPDPPKNEEKKKEQPKKQQVDDTLKKKEINVTKEEAPKKKDDVSKKKEESTSKEVTEVARTTPEPEKEPASPKKVESPAPQTMEPSAPKKIEASALKRHELPARPEPPARDKPKPGMIPKANPRPSRKTKLAAAIYMEILSHKLVDSKIDDDNVSIDSFPELPNVKRTEQREIELKAQAKRDDKARSLSDDDDDDEDNPLVIDEDALVVDDEVTAVPPEEATRASRRTTRSAPSQRSRAGSSEDEDDDSDQSFYVDVKVPRKRKMTRSKAPKPVGKVDELGSSSSESDESVNLQALVDKQKFKKFSKTKMTKKPDSFSDSDEEPLSKLTTKSVETHLSKREEAPDGKAKSQVSRTSGSEKPKRECAKKPQNYLPMFSSSDDEDTFHGFDKKAEALCVGKEASTSSALHLNLLTKDVDRRFGKEKVNMSNEQIEKWLNDSALAGNGVKKENDDMLKFGEKLPVDDETKTKLSPLKVEPKEKAVADATVASDEKTPLKFEGVEPKQAKPFVSDRKLIFRKNKAESMPNVNAFSPENESSVYAFGEESEELISTPFRRPSRRPSSTATSRSEDESSKHEDSTKIGHFRKPTPKGGEPDPNTDTDETSHQFYVPQKPTKHGFTGKQQQQQLTAPKGAAPRPKAAREKSSDPEDFKYKVPSSPSASSSSSTKPPRRQAAQKPRARDSVSPVYTSDFPRRSEQARLVEAPTFHPTEQEFQDPLEYIERIRHKAEQFGLCRIVPPGGFKPDCKVSDDMRFTAYNQYVHKMLHRWGPNFKELMAIKKYLETQNISVAHTPWIGGMEIDLPRLYQTVQNLGGLKEVIEKKKWPKVSELMKIPKSAQDRVTKLDDIYCKYLLPYDTLSPAEREKLFDEVETDWAKRESKGLQKVQEKNVNVDEDEDNESESESDDNDVEECITKGRNMALNGFYRIARNTMSMYFKVPEPSAQEVEQMYWNYVTMRENHICVHSGSIDSGSWGYGFAVSKNSPFARHPWNLKVLTNNSGSLLRSLGPVMGVTVPTLHVGMVFSACCWYRDPHGLPWIEYLHTGGSKIWYGIPDSMSDRFRSTLESLVPNYCRDTELWLPSDTVMVPPGLLVRDGVSLSRVVQEPGQFVVVFPKAFTSSIATGYVVSESVYFAPAYWLRTARALFDALRASCEPSMFSLDKLLLNLAHDPRCGVEVLRQVAPFVEELCSREASARRRLGLLGHLEREKLDVPDVGKRKKKFRQGDEGDYECDVCRMSLYVSVVFDFQETVTYCLDHAVEAIESKKASVNKLKLMIAYDDEELASVPDKVRGAIESKLQKKGGSK